MLDVATAAGHTALKFAPLVRRVVASDLTEAMLRQARRLAHAQELKQVRVVVADGEALPFPRDTFDIVTCRIALHHFPNVPTAIAEMARVCRRGGTVAIVDNIVPDVEDVAAWINDYERRRDPSHVRCHSLAALLSVFAAVGLSVRAAETLAKPMEYDGWMARMGVEGERAELLRVRLFDAPPAVRDWLKPRLEGERVLLELVEGVIVGEKTDAGAAHGEEPIGAAS